MKMKTVMMIAAGIAGAFLAAGTAHADTLLWYRFDGEGATITNKASPGTMDGTLKSIVWGQGVGNQGNDSSKFPIRGNAFPSDVGIIDPASDAAYTGQVKSLSFSGEQSTAGMVLLTKANAAPLVNLTSFTCEVFFKIPAAAASRTPALFPLVNWGEDQQQGWKFGFYRSSGTKLSPWFRGVQKTSAGAKGTILTINAANDNRDNYTYDTWHHLALVVDGAGDGSTATAKLILDYTEVQTLSISSYYGFYFNSSSAFPLTIGADMYRNRDTVASRETFMGDIAEFRISDTALAANQLLRPLSDGPVDADTLLYLPMGDCDWFGSPSTANYKNIYHGALNAAPTASCTPYWYLNDNSSVPYPAVSAYAADGTLRNGYLSTETFADVKSMNFSRVLGTTANDGDQYFGHVLRIPYENAHLAEGSFTMEWFFKTDGVVPSGNAINSYTFLNNTFAKIMINQSNGFLLTRLVKAAGGYEDFNTTVRVDDGQWHHYALVYDANQDVGVFAAYLDYRMIASKTYTLTTGTSAAFCFGGEGRYKQAFSGQLDDFRITKRAMKAGEFLTTRLIVSADTALFAHFDGDLSTGQDTAYAPDGVGGTLGGGTAPTFVNVSRRIDLNGDGTADYESTKALRLDGGSVVYPHNSLLECRDFTVEWFAKYDTLANTVMLLRFGMLSDTGTGSICWALYAPTGYLRLGAHVSSNGSWHDVYRQDKDFATGANANIADGKWHHWALVAQSNPNASPANTSFTLYRDYEQIGNTLVFDKAGAGGILVLPSTGTTLSFGTGGNAINGMIDELRFRPGVQPVSSFMRRLPNGFVMIVK